MVGEVFEHSGNTFKQYQVFYLQNKQMLAALTLMWGHKHRLLQTWLLSQHVWVCPQAESFGALSVKYWISSGWRWSSGRRCCYWAVLLNRTACLLTCSLWRKLSLLLTFLHSAFSLTFLLFILRWILGHSMTVNVAVSDCTEWDDSIFTTHWKAILAHNGKLK